VDEDKWAGQNVAISRQTSASFPQRTLWELKTLNLSLNVAKMGFSSPAQNLHFRRKIFSQFSNSLKFKGGGEDITAVAIRAREISIEQKNLLIDLSIDCFVLLIS